MPPGVFSRLEAMNRGYVEMTVSTIFVNAEDVRKSFLGGKGKSCHRVEVLKGGKPCRAQGRIHLHYGSKWFWKDHSIELLVWADECRFWVHLPR